MREQQIVLEIAESVEKKANKDKYNPLRQNPDIAKLIDEEIKSRNLELELVDENFLYWNFNIAKSTAIEAINEILEWIEESDYSAKGIYAIYHSKKTGIYYIFTGKYISKMSYAKNYGFFYIVEYYIDVAKMTEKQFIRWLTSGIPILRCIKSH
jgi:hypothetical protein